MLSTLNDESIIKKIMELRENEKTECWESLSKEEEESLEKGIKDADSGELKPHSEAKKSYGKWL